MNDHVWDEWQRDENDLIRYGQCEKCGRPRRSVIVELPDGGLLSTMQCDAGHSA